MTDTFGEDEATRRAGLAREAERRRRDRWVAILAAFESAPGGVVRLGGAVRGRFERAAEALGRLLDLERGATAPPRRWRPWGGVLVRDLTAEDLGEMPRRRGPRWVDKRGEMRRWS